MSAFAVHAVGFTEGQALQVLLILTVVAVIASFGWGFLADRWGPRRTLFAVLGTWALGLAIITLFLSTVPFLVAAGYLPAVPSDDQLAVLRAAVPLVQERMDAFAESVDLLGFLFAGEHFVIEPDAAAKVLAGDAGEVLEASAKALEGVEWTTAAIEAALRASLVDGLGLKPKKAFGPVRVAVSGRRVSPPLFESMELLGRETSLRRIEQARVKVEH